MIAADLIAVLATVAFVGLFVGTSMLAGRGFGLEQRAGLLERRDPGSAAALRRAQSVTDFTSSVVFGEGFSAVCTPSRRSGLDLARTRGVDSDLRVEVPEETLPPMPATVVALGGRSEHVPQAPRPRHPLRSAQSDGGAKRSGHQPTASG